MAVSIIHLRKCLWDMASTIGLNTSKRVFQAHECRPCPQGRAGSGLSRGGFVLALHAQGQVTTERLVTLLNGIRVEICKRQVVRLLTEPLDTSVAKDQEVPRAWPRRTR